MLLLDIHIQATQPYNDIVIIAPLNRGGDSLKQKRGITRIAGYGRDPTPKFRDKFDPIGANGAQCLYSNRYKRYRPRQISILAVLGIRGRLGSSPSNMHGPVQMRIS